MGEAAPQEAAPGKTITEHDLAALRHGRGEAYLVGHDGEHGWWASRRDQIGGLITESGPDELWTAILADYQLKPVPRDYCKPLDADDDLPPGTVLRDSDDDGEPA